jgi:hypothetical protein
MLGRLMRVSLAAGVVVLAAVAAAVQVGIGRAAASGLAVSVAGPAKVAVNEDYSYTVTVENSGAVTAGSVAVVSSYYTSSLEDWNGAQGATCTSLGGGRMSCAIGDVAAGATRSFTIKLSATTAGTDSRTFVATSGSDPTLTGSGSYTTTITAPKTGPTPPKIVPSVALHTAGSTMTLVLKLKNEGPGGMSKITLGDRYDYPDLTIKPHKGCKVKPYYVTCKVSRLARGASSNLRLVAHMSSVARAETRFLNVVSVSFPWRTNTSGFQENDYQIWTTPTKGH